MPCTYVVGVAENIKESKPRGRLRLLLLPAGGAVQSDEWRTCSCALAVRRRSAREAVRRRLQREMPGASYMTVTPFSEIIGSQTRSWQLGATMFVAFGALALVLAAIGLYSVIAYNVAQRTHELGVRVALGAQARDVVRLVVTDGLRLAGMGVAIGAAYRAGGEQVGEAAAVQRFAEGSGGVRARRRDADRGGDGGELGAGAPCVARRSECRVAIGLAGSPGFVVGSFQSPIYADERKSAPALRKSAIIFFPTVEHNWPRPSYGMIGRCCGVITCGVPASA